MAYLDPGPGSFLIQLLIGVLIGSMVFFRKYWSQLRSFLSRTVKRSSVPSEPARGRGSMVDRISHSQMRAVWGEVRYQTVTSVSGFSYPETKQVDLFLTFSPALNEIFV